MKIYELSIAVKVNRETEILVESEGYFYYWNNGNENESVKRHRFCGDTG